MFSSIKRTLGVVDVYATPKYVTVEGIDTFVLLRDMYRVWSGNQVGNQMFSAIQSGKLRFLHFFALDFKYVCETLIDDPQTRSSRRVLSKVLHELKEKTWVGDIDRVVASITNEKDIDHLVPFPLKPFQRDFVRHFGKMVPAYRLRGYMLDAGAGTGKTVTQMILAHCLGVKKMIIIVPKNSVERVWRDTAADIMLQKKPYWVSTEDKPLHSNAYYYIVHYEQLKQMVDYVKANPRDFENTYLGLDESHNFNRMSSDRTQLYIDLAAMPQMKVNLWASGTPIQALGVECIPFLKCIDPLFNDEAEERFRKIYGRDAKRANDILRNRIGHLKYHVPKQDVVDIPVNTKTVLVKMPTGNEYTLEAIGEKMRKFIEARTAFYDKHKAEFKHDYDRALTYFEQHAHFNKADYAAYKAAVALISKGFDPKTMKAESMMANSFERKVIIPHLPNAMKEDFRKAKSVVKYVNLTILGECLGTVLGGSRSKCHLDMVDHIDFSKLIDGAKKKTLIFTSFVEVLEKANKLIQQQGYEPAAVYGATNKNLSSIVKSFFENDDINPLLATYPSLSTAVPLTAASSIIMINQPFREAIRIQTIARAARLGQDTPVDVWDVLLDTGDKPNISTRSNDIMQWSAEMTASILGVSNVDLDTMQLESKKEFLDDIIKLAEESFESFDNQTLEPPAGEHEEEESLTNLPTYLFHSSAYKQNELKPGFKHSGELVKWDGVEDNTWLYSCDKKQDAMMLGISSAIEKKWNLQRYKYDAKTHRLDIEVVDETITKGDIEKLHVYIYTIRPDAKDGWVENFNPINGMNGEYKTQGTIDENILRCETVDIINTLRGYTVNIKRVAGPSFESVGGLIDSIKKYFQGPTQKEVHGETIPRADYPIAEATKVNNYLKQFFGNPSWVAKQQFNTEVSSAGIAQPLSFKGKFNPSAAMEDIEKGIAGFLSQAGAYEHVLMQTNAAVQTVFEKYETILTKELHGSPDHDKISNICDQANEEFTAIGKKNAVQTLIGHEYFFMGGRHVKIVKSDNDYGVTVQRFKPDAVQVGDKIPAMTPAQIEKAVAIIHQCLDNAKAGKGASHAGWLDFEDGGVWDLLHNFSPSLYMDYAEQWYHQRVWDELEGGFPYYNRWYSDIIIALLHWMDRSVK